MQGEGLARRRAEVRRAVRGQRDVRRVAAGRFDVERTARVDRDADELAVFVVVPDGVAGIRVAELLDIGREVGFRDGFFRARRADAVTRGERDGLARDVRRVRQAHVARLFVHDAVADGVQEIVFRPAVRIRIRLGAFDECFAIIRDGRALVRVIRVAKAVEICGDGRHVGLLRRSGGFRRLRSLRGRDVSVTRRAERRVGSISFCRRLVVLCGTFGFRRVVARACEAARLLVAQGELLQAPFKCGQARGLCFDFGVCIAVRRVVFGNDACVFPLFDERVRRRLGRDGVVRRVRDAAVFRREAHVARLAHDLVDWEVSVRRGQRDVAIGRGAKARALGNAFIRKCSELHRQRVVLRADGAVRRRELDARGGDGGVARIRGAEDVLRRRDADGRAFAIRLRALRFFDEEIAEARVERDVAGPRRKIDGCRVAALERGLREVDARRRRRREPVRRDRAAAFDFARLRRERDII